VGQRETVLTFVLSTPSAPHCSHVPFENGDGGVSPSFAINRFQHLRQRHLISLRMCFATPIIIPSVRIATDPVPTVPTVSFLFRECSNLSQRRAGLRWCGWRGERRLVGEQETGIEEYFREKPRPEVKRAGCPVGAGPEDVDGVTPRVRLPVAGAYPWPFRQ
jgi:hypothetical protein